MICPTITAPVYDIQYTYQGVVTNVAKDTVTLDSNKFNITRETILRMQLKTGDLLSISTIKGHPDKLYICRCIPSNPVAPPVAPPITPPVRGLW